MEQRYSITQLPDVELFTPQSNQELVKTQIEQNKLVSCLVQNG